MEHLEKSDKLPVEFYYLKARYQLKTGGNVPEVFKDAVERFPNNVKLKLKYIYALWYNGEKNKAKIVLDRVLEEYPDLKNRIFSDPTLNSIYGYKGEK